MTDVLGIAQSILGQPWRWRALAADARDGLGHDDLVGHETFLTFLMEQQILEVHECTNKHM